jgi:hypothetical protein
MEVSPNPLRKLYFFSILYGEAQRVLNMHWDSSLGLIHMVTSVAYRSIDMRAKAIAQRAEPVISLNEDYWKALTDVCRGLAEYVESDDDNSALLLGLLARMADLSYMTTGNGYYLHMKGEIKVFEETSALPQPS